MVLDDEAVDREESGSGEPGVAASGGTMPGFAAPGGGDDVGLDFTRGQ
jgi:hypothetical protein